ncbi:MAG: S-layer homology domain-containing protein, partial [Oscillospiraceae bacterium]
VGDGGLMNGTANRIFSPDAEMSRAMVVTVLWRIEGAPEPTTSGTFSDVPDGQWYSKAVYWANEKGIVQGFEGSFKPTTAISREQLAAILYRYSGSPATSGVLDSFTDASTVSAWAQSALYWTVEQKYVGGVTETLLSPQSTATRAQVATILFRMSE